MSYAPMLIHLFDLFRIAGSLLRGDHGVGQARESRTKTSRMRVSAPAVSLVA